jgi:predicted nucleic acid-binding protein
MSGRVTYLDTSAFVKLVTVERESAALRRFLGRWPRRASAAVLRTEVARALRRAGYEARVGTARRLLAAMWLVRPDEPLLDRAGELEPRTLRSLDALHLAAAPAIGPELGAFLTYDERLAEAARGVGLTVHAPG